MFKEIEIIIHAICVAATSMSVESVIESMVSMYEVRNNKHRPISEERAELEMMIAVNGPNIEHADSVIDKSMRQYWKESGEGNKTDWHFVRRSDKVTDFTASRVVERMKKSKPELPFMTDSNSALKINDV